MDTKICIYCKQELNIDLFRKNRNYCHECENLKSKQYRLEHKEKYKSYNKQYCEANKQLLYEKRTQKYKDNKEAMVGKGKQYYKDNKERIDIQNKEWREKNKETRKLKNKQYHIDHKEERNKCSKQHYANNKLYYSEREKVYKKTHLEQNRIFCQKYRALKRKLEATLTVEQWENIKMCFDNRCVYCGKKLPLVQEHFIAVSKGGEYTINNILPSCTTCNSSKNNKPFKTWYKTYKYYSKKREKTILDYLNYDNDIQQLSII